MDVIPLKNGSKMNEMMMIENDAHHDVESGSRIERASVKAGGTGMM